MTKHNAAIYLLFESKTFRGLSFFLFKNWNYKYNYPVHIHHFDDIYSGEF